MSEQIYHRVGEFLKVCYFLYEKSINKYFPNMDESEILESFNEITTPHRATSGSAGYDFVCPVDVVLSKENPVTIPTGIRARINDGWFLSIHPRSSLGFKYGMRLTNTTGIIDSDYFHADNDGHIMVKLSVDCDKPVYIHKGDRICQGIFLPYGITYDDECVCSRTGGMGSTGK